MPATKKKNYATHVTLDDGSRIYIRGKSKADLEKKKEEVKARQGLGMTTATSTTFREYATLWLGTYKPQSALRPTSYQTVCNTLNNHVMPFFGDLPLTSIKPMHIRRFLTEINGTSKSQQQKSWGMVKSIFATAVDNHLLSESPIKSTDKLLPAAAEEEEEPLTDEQVKSLLDAISGSRVYLFVMLALGLGLRRGEILGLMWSDVDLKTGVVKVRHNKAFAANQNNAPVTELLKTDAGRREIPIPEKLILLLKNENQLISPYVLHDDNGDSWNRSSFRSAWTVIERRTVGYLDRKLGDTYGEITTTLDFKTHPHQLRHTYITKLFEQGLDIKQVQYLAGHATPEITMKIYTHYRKKQRDADTKQQVVAAVNYL